MLPFLAPIDTISSLFEGNLLTVIAFVLIFWYALFKLFDMGDLWP